MRHQADRRGGLELHVRTLSERLHEANIARLESRCSIMNANMAGNLTPRRVPHRLLPRHKGRAKALAPLIAAGETCEVELCPHSVSGQMPR